MLNVQAEIIKMESPQVAEAFMRFKPMCDSFLKQPQRSVLVSLIKLIKSLPNEVIQDLHTYLMFPFVVHLRGAKENFKDDMKAALADGVHEILSKIQLGSLELFHKYYSLLIYQIFDRTTPNTVAHIDEDCALSFIRAITTLTLRITQEVRNKLYTRSKAPEIGQGIYLSVQIARSSSYKPLKIAAIHCIMALTTVHDDLIKEELDNQYVDRVGEVLMFFLPGLLGGLQEVAMGNPKQGHTVTCLAIRGINNILCLVMHDRERESNAANITDQHFVKLIAAHKAKTTQETPAECDPFGKKLRHKGHTGMLEHLESAKRDDDWYKAAANRLLILIRSLKPLQNHDHEKVRLELAFLCWNIISCCIINMQPSLRDILEMLVAMSENDMEEVRRSSDKALEEYSKKIKNGKLLLSHLEENFYNDLSKLPRCLNALETREHIAGLNLLKGYVRLLTSPKYKPQKLTEILSSSFILNRLVFVLIEVFKMECSGIKILEDFSVRDVEFEMMQTCPWKVFKNLQNEACVKIALEICQILGASEAVEMVADSLLEQLRESEHKKEIILVLNELLSSPVEEKDLKEHLVENLINTYIDIEMWYMPIVVCRKERPPGKHETLDVTVYNPREWIKERTFDLYEGATETRYTDLSYRPDRCDIQDEGQEFMAETCKTIAEAQDNVIKICLMTEGIGKMAVFLGVEFDKFLLKTLYLVLERAGSSNEMIHLAGLKALSDITKACKMKDVTELIKQNADYFTHHVNLKLRRISENIGVLDVLLVVMRYSETAVLPCLYEIVDNVLDQCVDVHQHSNMILFLRLFFTFIKYIKTKFPSNETVMEQQQNPCLNSIIEQIMDYHYNKCKSTNFDDEDSNKTAYEMYKEDNMEIVDEETEDVNITEKKTPPIHITMVVSILKKTLNFIPSNDREQKILALSILKEGIGAIKDWEDELLPLVHLVWSPLVNRFRETSQPIIINRSFQLLLTLAEYSKDFIRTRTLKEVMPILCNILVKSASDSHMKDIGSTYRFTQSYKLQLALLEGMGHLCLSLNLQEREIYKVVNAVTIYLTCKQPKPLQLACMNMFKLFMDHDPAPIWLHLNGLWNEQENIKPPNDLFTAFTCVLADPQKKLDYQQNVRLLLEYHKGNQMDETQQEEIKEEEIKIDEIKQEELKADEIKQREINTKIKQEEVKPDEIKQEGIKPDEIKHEEVKPDEIKQEKTNLDETETEGNL